MSTRDYCQTIEFRIKKGPPFEGPFLVASVELA